MISHFQTIAARLGIIPDKNYQKYKSLLSTGIAIIGISAGTASAQAASYNVAWQYSQPSNAESLTKWCANGECHALICKQGKVFYTIASEPKPGIPTNTPYRLVIDQQSTYAGSLKLENKIGSTWIWTSSAPLPFAIQQQLAAGNAVKVDRFNSSIGNTLKGSGKAIKQLWASCQINVHTANNLKPASKTKKTASLRSSKLDQLCQPYYPKVRYHSGYNTSNLNGSRYIYLNRYGTEQSTHDIGRRTFRLFNGWFEADIRYFGANNRPLGFHFRLPADNLTLTPAILSDLTKLRNLTLKFFDWKEVAIKNGIREFREDFPNELRPSVSDRLNFRFTVYVGSQDGKTHYGLHALNEHGFCWLYAQTTNLEKIIRSAQQSMLEEQRVQQEIKNQANETSQKFQ